MNKTGDSIEMRPQTFSLRRGADPSGISGTGHVADGVMWPDGSASLRWRGENPSVVYWDRFESVRKVYVHNGSTRLVWDLQAITPPDLTTVQARLQTVLQGEIEHWDDKELLETMWRSVSDIQPLLAEIARLRALIPAEGARNASPS